MSTSPFPLVTPIPPISSRLVQDSNANIIAGKGHFESKNTDADVIDVVAVQSDRPQPRELEEAPESADEGEEDDDVSTEGATEALVSSTCTVLSTIIRS